MGPTLPKNKVGAQPQASRGWEASTLGEHSEQPHLPSPLSSALSGNVPFCWQFHGSLTRCSLIPSGKGWAFRKQSLG